jgi:phosphoribosyl 1,2-cyclic phosphodiesterase
MTDPSPLVVKFWGVRGSTPTPQSENLGFGGNTTCFEIQTAGERIIIDAGTGIRRLGLHLSPDEAKNIHLFLTHFHWDHIQGIPFFVPLLRPGNKVTFHSFPHEDEIRARLEQQMTAPFFTLDFNSVGAGREYQRVDETFRLGDLSVTSFPLNHPQGACGYRVECQRASIVIATDVEHGDPKLDTILREQSEGADILVYDAQYTLEEYETRKGWGHSHYQAAASVARDANVGKLVLFHHDPNHDDAAMDKIVQRTKHLFESTVAAVELHSIRI